MASSTTMDVSHQAQAQSKNQNQTVDEFSHRSLAGSGARFVASQRQLDEFESQELTVVVQGRPRAYGTERFLTAQAIAELYQGDMAALYAQLSGQFVLLVDDKSSGVTHLVNDHLCSVPCYIAQVDSEVLISTTMQGILACVQTPLTLSLQAIFNYCYFHCIPAPTTIYQEVSKLQPAEYYQLSQQGISSQGSLYEPAFCDQGEGPADAHQQCLDDIQLAVKHSLADKVGAFLSGGLDSSTVSGMLAKQRPPARTFSVGFNEPGYDETEYAEITARHFGTEHEAAYLEPDYISQNFRKVATSFDEPFGNSSALAAYFCASYAKARGIDVMLAGDGGDELFAGNSRYAKQKLFYPYERLPGFARALLKGLFVSTPLGSLPLAKKVRSYIQQAENPLPDRLQAYNFLHRFSPQEMFTERFLQQVDTEMPLNQLRERYHQAKASSPVDKMLYMDWKFTLADNDLIKVSKMCELAGVEVRFPLIEKELVDFSSRLPAKVKLPGQKLRHFFKTATKDFLAAETLNKSKHGFGLPFGRWMRSTPELIEVTQSALESLRARDIVNPGFIDQALTMQQEQHSAYYGELIWILTVLELWLQSRENAA